MDGLGRRKSLPVALRNASRTPSRSTTGTAFWFPDATWAGQTARAATGPACEDGAPDQSSRPGRTALPAVGFLTIIRTWLRLIILGVVVGTVVSLAVALITPPSYLSKVTLIVTPTTTTGAITFSDVEVTQALAPTFAELATTTPVLDRVIADTKVDLGTTALAKTVETHVPVGTSLIEISVTNRDPAMAASIANAIASELAQYQAHGAAQVSALRVSLAVVDPANTPTIPEGLGIPVRAALGGLIGLMLAVSIGFFVENLGRGVRSVGRDLAGGTPPAPPSAAPVESPTDRLARGFGDTDRAQTSTIGAMARPGPSTPLSQTVVRPVLAAQAPAMARPTGFERPATTAPAMSGAPLLSARPAESVGVPVAPAVAPASTAVPTPVPAPVLPPADVDTEPEAATSDGDPTRSAARGGAAATPKAGSSGRGRRRGGEAST